MLRDTMKRKGYVYLRVVKARQQISYLIPAKDFEKLPEQQKNLIRKADKCLRLVQIYKENQLKSNEKKQEYL